MSAAEVRMHSALHVLKGAVVSVLGPRKTTSMHATGERGNLTVEMDRNPTPEEIAAIQNAANRKIAENAEVLQFQMERREAEGHFGTTIYEAFPVADAQLLNIVRIAEWEVDCCSAEHIDSTGELIAIKIEGAKFNPDGGQLELEFILEG